MSQYVRRRDKGVCFTCGDMRPWKEQQAGHYIHGCLDYDEININCQCVRCNKWLHGNSGVYAEKLIKKYGSEEIALLRKRSKMIIKYSVLALEDLIDLYKETLEDM